jgi:hypothetical protein
MIVLTLTGGTARMWKDERVIHNVNLEKNKLIKVSSNLIETLPHV